MVVSSMLVASYRWSHGTPLFWRSVSFAEFVVGVARVVRSGALQAVGTALLLAGYEGLER
jgi:hypothetical protein